MLTITEKIPDFDTYEDYLGYCSEGALFFDIETTGLSPASAIVFLIGVVKKTGDGWLLTQWLVQRPEDEPLLLQAFFDTAAGCDTLIHFNGTTFDLPFLRERARLLCRAGIANSINGKRSLDLYQKFRPLKRPLGLSRMNQTTLEQFLGWTREDRLIGKHMVELFHKYAASQEPLLCDLLLLHNHDDLLGMTDLLRLCAYSMLFDGQLDSAEVSVDETTCLKVHLTLKSALPRDISRALPSPDSCCATHGSDSCYISQTFTDQKAALTLHGSDSYYPPHGSDPCYTLIASGMKAVLSVPGFQGELRHFFSNYRDYYYLPVEDQVIHKSVGAFVEKEYRVPATPANCYIKKSGLFFPQPKEFFSPAFKSSYESKALFFACPDPDASPFEQKSLIAYAASFLCLFARGRI